VASFRTTDLAIEPARDCLTIQGRDVSVTDFSRFSIFFLPESA
jgi:hypothetical protein